MLFSILITLMIDKLMAGYHIHYKKSLINYDKAERLRRMQLLRDLKSPED